MTVYLVVVLVCMIAAPPHNYQEWKSFIAAPAMSVATVLLFGMLLLHAWVGVRDVVMDYVHPYAVRLVVLVLVAAALVALGVWMLQVMAKVW